MTDNKPSQSDHSFLIIGLVAVACGVSFGLWRMVGGPDDIARREAIEWDRSGGKPEGPPPNPGTLIAGSGVPSEHGGSWPWFRGESRENIAKNPKPLARKWSAAGPPELWRLKVGEGYAGVAIHNGRVYLIDYDREKEEDAIRCLSLDDGAEIWRYTYSVIIKRFHGMTRTVPSVTDKYVVALGPKCHLHCLDAVTGELVWKKNLVEENSTVVPQWYAGQCPVIDGDRVIIAPGADPLMMAVELTSGGVIWETPEEFDGEGMTHSTILPVTLGGVYQYVYCAKSGVFGVEAATGKVLWSTPDWKIGIANVPTPLPVGDDRLFLTGGYEAGSMMLKVTNEGGAFSTEELWRLNFEIYGSEQQTPIFYKNHIYAVVYTGEMACLDLDGNVVWDSGGEYRFGLGAYLISDGLCVLLDDPTCSLHLATVDGGYKELASYDIFEGHEPWGPMAIANGRLIVRDLTELVCFDLSAQ